MTASKSKILAIAMIVAVALFLAVFAIFASSFNKRDEQAAEAEPTATPTAARAVCFIGSDLSDAAQYDLAKKIGFYVDDMSGYTYKLYNAQGSAAKQAELIDEAAAAEPAYIIVWPQEGGALTAVGGSLAAVTGADVINVNGSALYMNSDNICSIAYDMQEAERLSDANDGCAITADAAMAAAVEDGVIPAVVYLDNAVLARAVASAISGAGGGAALAESMLTPQLVTGR